MVTLSSVHGVLIVVLIESDGKMDGDLKSEITIICIAIWKVPSLRPLVLLVRAVFR